MSAQSGGRTPRHTARRIAQEAKDRDLVPGDRVASEPNLIKFFEVSRGTLREALRLLNYLGIITSRPGRTGGTRVGAPTPAVVASALAAVASGRDAPVRATYASAVSLLPTAAGLAASNRTSDHVAAMSAAVEGMANSTDEERFAHHEQIFTSTLAAACGNAVMETIASAVLTLTALTDPRDFATRQRQVVSDSRQLLAAIVGAAESDAVAAAHTILTRQLEQLDRDHPAQMAAPISWADLDEQLESISLEGLP